MSKGSAVRQREPGEDRRALTWDDVTYENSFPANLDRGRPFVVQVVDRPHQSAVLYVCDITREQRRSFFGFEWADRYAPGIYAFGDVAKVPPPLPEATCPLCRNFPGDAIDGHRLHCPRGAQPTALTVEQAWQAIERGEWVTNGGYTWRNVDTTTGRGGEYWGQGPYPGCIRTCAVFTRDAVAVKARTLGRPWRWATGLHCDICGAESGRAHRMDCPHGPERITVAATLPSAAEDDYIDISSTVAAVAAGRIVDKALRPAEGADLHEDPFTKEEKRLVSAILRMGECGHTGRPPTWAAVDGVQRKLGVRIGGEHPREDIRWHWPMDPEDFKAKAIAAGFKENGRFVGTPRHKTPDFHALIDAHPDPVALVEEVTGLRPEVAIAGHEPAVWQRMCRAQPVSLTFDSGPSQVARALLHHLADHPDDMPPGGGWGALGVGDV